MKKIFNTKFGEVTIKYALIDFEGFLEEGVDILLNNKFIGKKVGFEFSKVEKMTIIEVEEIVNGLL